MLIQKAALLSWSLDDLAGAWGGGPEILALSRLLRMPVQVLQLESRRRRGQNTKEHKTNSLHTP